VSDEVETKVDREVDSVETREDGGSGPTGAVDSAAEEPGDSVLPGSTAAVGLEERLAAAEASRDEYLDHLQRLAAEFDNYRKRVARDQQAFASRATAGLVERLLPVLDDLERALDAAEQHDEGAVIDGVRLTRDALRAALEAEGLEEIGTDGAFDPHVHEALMTQPAEEASSGAVVDVVQKGYRLGDSVLRPARVIVAE
jgi:molecular chaperone GrpE